MTFVLPSGKGMIRLKPPPVWVDNFDQSTYDTNVSNGDSGSQWRQPLTLTAGTLTKLRAGISINTFNQGIRFALYDTTDALVTEGGSGSSGLGWNELSVTPVVVIAGLHHVMLRALANSDLSWAGLASINFELIFGGPGYFAAFPATLPATEYSTVGGIAVGGLVAPP